MNKAKIGGLTYKIKFIGQVKDKEDNEFWGIIEPHNLEIKICSKCPKERQMLTIVHETLHGISNEYDLNLSENKITRLGSALFAFMKDNKKLIEEICQ